MVCVRVLCVCLCISRRAMILITRRGSQAAPGPPGRSPWNNPERPSNNAAWRRRRPTTSRWTKRRRLTRDAPRCCARPRRPRSSATWRNTVTHTYAHKHKHTHRQTDRHTQTHNPRTSRDRAPEMVAVRHERRAVGLLQIRPRQPRLRAIGPWQLRARAHTHTQSLLPRVHIHRRI